MLTAEIEQTLWQQAHLLLPKPRRTIQERFDEFNAAHPQVLEWLLTRAVFLRDQGKTRISMKLLFEEYREKAQDFPPYKALTNAV